MRSLLLLLLLCLSLACSGAKPPTLDAGPPGVDCPPGVALAGECQRDADCASGVCVADSAAPLEDGAPVPLLCAPASAAGDGLCSQPSDCARGVCLVSGSCAGPCVDDADCDGGDVCRHAWALRSSEVAQDLGACVPRVLLPTGVSAERLPRAALLSSSAPRVTLPLAVGPSLRVFLPSCGAEVNAHRLALMDGTELFGPSAGDADHPPINPIAALGRPLTLLVPSGSDAPAAPDGYALELDSTGEGSVEQITLRGVPGPGSLALQLFYVGVPGWAPVGDAPPPEVQAALAELLSILSAASITAYVAGQHVIPGQLATRLAVLDETPDGHSPEREELFALSAGLRQPALPVFFVRAMDRGALGASGGIPGPQGVMASTGSGVVVAASIIGEERLSLGAVLTHEVGHFLGLFHTSEINGSGVEALGDTPVCDPLHDADGDGVLAAGECSGFGSENLMFWSGRGRGTELTADQATILRGAVLLER